AFRDKAHPFPTCRRGWMATAVISPAKIRGSKLTPTPWIQVRALTSAVLPTKRMSA
ncbi:unnamed protein product, partial [Symbiodinium pilosum]